jgi:hypothetical protein
VVKIGDRIWSISLSAVDEDYGKTGPERPWHREPWLAEVYDVHENGDFWIAFVDKDGTVSNRCDANSTAFINKSKKVYGTKIEAYFAWREALYSHIDGLTRDILRCTELLQRTELRWSKKHKEKDDGR